MMIKKRLTFSNILMVVIPVILIGIISAAMRVPFSNMMDKTMRNIEEKIRWDLILFNKN